jgi:hypothetical protein
MASSCQTAALSCQNRELIATVDFGIFSSVADPDPGSGAFLAPGSGIRIGKPGWKKSGSGIQNVIPDHISDRLETNFGLKILKFFYADPDPGSF